MSIIEIRVAGRFKLRRKIGSGSFGDIYLGKAKSCSFDKFSPKCSNKWRSCS